MTTPPKDARPGAAFIARLPPEQAEEMAATRDYLLPKDAPVTEAGRRLLDGIAQRFDEFAVEHRTLRDDVLEYTRSWLEAEAATAARSDEIDVETLAEALHDAMCDVSHHDRPPARCSRWSKYPNIALSVVPRYARLRSEQGERTPRVDPEIDAT